MLKVEKEVEKKLEKEKRWEWAERKKNELLTSHSGHHPDAVIVPVDNSRCEEMNVLLDDSSCSLLEGYEEIFFFFFFLRLSYTCP